VGASPQIGKILTLLLPFSCPVLSFLLLPTPSWNRAADIHALWLKWVTRFSSKTVPFWVRTISDIMWRKCVQETHPKGAWIGIFSQITKITNWNISKKPYIRLVQNLVTKLIHQRHVVGGPSLPYMKYNMADVRHLENWHNVIARLLTVRFKRNLVCRCKMRCRWRLVGHSRNRNSNFNMAAVLFPKPEVVMTQPWIETSLRNLVHLETFWRHGHYQTGTGSWFATSTAAILKILMTS